MIMSVFKPFTVAIYLPRNLERWIPGISDFDGADESDFLQSLQVQVFRQPNLAFSVHVDEAVFRIRIRREDHFPELFRIRIHALEPAIRIDGAESCQGRSVFRNLAVNALGLTRGRVVVFVENVDLKGGFGFQGWRALNS